MSESDNLIPVLLTNVPEDVDSWALKKTVPEGLIHRVEINPSNPSKMMVFAIGQENAQQISRMLDNFNLFGSVIQARCAFTKIPASVSSTNDPSTVTDYSKQGHVQCVADMKKKSDADDKKIGHSSKNVRPQPLMSIDSGVRQQFPHCRLQILSPVWSYDLAMPTNCRILIVAFSKVRTTEKGIKPSGHDWPESSVVKVEGLCAGPVIQYMEKNHLQEKMSPEHIRIMFGWLTNSRICYNCGAAGHKDTDGMCKYLPLGRTVTDEEIAQSRKPFSRRMRGIRDKVSFGKLQRHAHFHNLQFRDSMGIQPERPLQYPLKRKEEDKEENLVKKISRQSSQRSGHLDPRSMTQATGGTQASK